MSKNYDNIYQEERLQTVQFLINKSSNLYNVTKNSESCATFYTSIIHFFFFFFFVMFTEKFLKKYTSFHHFVKNNNYNFSTHLLYFFIILGVHTGLENDVSSGI